MLKKIILRYMPGEKFVTREVWEKFLPKLNHPYPAPAQKSNGQPHRGWARSGFDTLVDVIRQQNGWREFIMWWFFFFKIENTPIKRHKWKGKVQKMLRLLYVNKRKLFAMKLSFEKFYLVFFTADQSAWLVLNQPS